jgi:hypothetical protein
MEGNAGTRFWPPAKPHKSGLGAFSQGEAQSRMARGIARSWPFPGSPEGLAPQGDDVVLRVQDQGHLRRQAVEGLALRG